MRFLIADMAVSRNVECRQFDTIQASSQGMIVRQDTTLCTLDRQTQRLDNMDVTLRTINENRQHDRLEISHVSVQLANLQQCFEALVTCTKSKKRICAD
jgi:hypothetical protein